MTGLPTLTKASLRLSPVDRLREAARNIHYIVTDPEHLYDVDSRLAHHWDVTPVHEAARAAAYTLAGRQVREVAYFPFGAVGMMGKCYLHPSGVKQIDPRKFIELWGIDGLAREAVAAFAGPISEVRYNPRSIKEEAENDLRSAEKIFKNVEAKDLGDRFEWHTAAWQETCRMMECENVWSAVIEIADRLKRSTSMRPRVSGNAVRSIVARHCPGGWNWNGIFAKAGDHHDMRELPRNWA